MADDEGGIGRSTRALLTALLGSSTELVVVVDEQGSIDLITPGVSELLGHRPDTLLGRPVFEFVHPDDVATAADLFVQRLTYDGADPGLELRARHASGSWIRVNVTATPLPSYAAAALTLRTETGDARERTLERRVAVTELANRLGTDLMNAPDATTSLVILEATLGEVGLLSGAQVVEVHIERPDRQTLEPLARWRSPGSTVDESADLVVDGPSLALLVEQPHLVDDLRATNDTTNDTTNDATNDATNDTADDTAARLTSITRAYDAVSICSAPFTTGERRGVVLLLGVRQPINWWDSDSEMTRGMAAHYGRVLRAAWSDELLTLSYHHGPVAFVIRTFDGTLIDHNQRYHDLVGDPTLAPETGHDRRTDDAFVEFSSLRDGTAERVEHEHHVSRPDGSSIWVRCTSVPLHLPGTTERFVMTAVEDITERRQQRIDLEWAATHDALTGVANRSEMSDRVTELAARTDADPALFIIDLDEFKFINDVHGHAVGDGVLTTVARRLEQLVRPDDLVARLGGDEFAVVVRNASSTDVLELAERFRHSLEQPIVIDGRSIRHTVSIGIATGVEAGDVANLLVRADRALYAAKHGGRNRSHLFDETLRDAVLDRLALERDLRVALEQGQFEIHYQPDHVLDGDRAIAGAEALVRWRRPAHGLVSAATFIAVVEESGLIDDLGEFVLRTATAEFAALCERTGRTDLSLRVNVAGGEFGRAELPAIVAEALDRSGLRATQLFLDVTESTLIRAPDVSADTIARLRELGVRLAIDNFGASSLMQLKRLPIDLVTIDRSLVDDIASDSASRAIIESVVTVSSTLGLSTIAEGIETEEQLDVLRAIGCERGQGYFFSPPVPLAEFEQFVG
ncbi:MAG: sensor domain-containing protein [Ilumatobacteraceae bacterium]